METLLISQQSRTEIVLGKFFTVMLASMSTALLNLVSMGLTGIQLAGQVTAGTRGGKMATMIAPPSPSSYFWMMLLLVPLSAFFGALCVALATLARSMKEGQYYMTPLYLASLPLILITLAPEVSLTLFYSLVPITGVSLLLKALILGDYDTARRFFLPVLLPTLVYAWLALRWAVDLFRREDVVFREAEAFDLKSWLRSLIQNKEPTPSAGAAIFCFALMLSLAWFSMQPLGKVASPVAGMVLGHLAFILAPPVLLAFVFTSNPLGTLRLRRPRMADLGIAAGLALGLNPIVREVGFHRREAVPRLVGRPGRSRGADPAGARPRRRLTGLRPDASAHRGAGLSRIHPDRPRADVFPGDGDRPLGGCSLAFSTSLSACSSNFSEQRCWAWSLALSPSGPAVSGRASCFTSSTTRWAC